MNDRELNVLLESIRSNCTDIERISKSVTVNKNRCAKMGEYAHEISSGLSNLKIESLRNSQRASDALLLLSISIEDVKSFVEKFSVLNNELAVLIMKSGSHCLEFVKLTEQLEHCCVLVNLDIEISDEDGFDQDCADLTARLPILLKPLFKDSERQSLINFVGKTRLLIKNQTEIKKSYKGKRSRNDEVTMRSEDLEILKPIGKGGFSTVWMGNYRGEHVAIKVLNVESSNISVKEFQNEADLMRRLSNKNIVAYYGITEIYNTRISGHCMIMEYMANDSLFTYIKNNRSAEQSWSKKVDIALDVASGIAFLHRLRIIHRDIKLGNVLLDEYLHAKVADFGMSFAKTSANSTYKMNEGGTIPYMAPECFGMNAVYSTKSDVFAFAILCWGLMHWELPFSTYDRDTIKDMVWKERFRLPIDSKIPTGLSSMIKLCWEQNYSHRPPMIEIKEFLEKAVYIDGIQVENPVLATEMTSTATIPYTDTPRLKDGKLPLANINEASEIDRSIYNQIPNSANRGLIDTDKPILNSKRNVSRRKLLLIVGALLVALLVAGIVGGTIYYFSSKSSSPNQVSTSTTFAVMSTTRTKTISRTPYPTATVSTLYKNNTMMDGVYGITIDPDDNLYVIIGKNPSKPVIYKVSTTNSDLPILIANLTDDNLRSSNDDQGICYYDNALYVPRMGQLTKIDLAKGNLVTRFAGQGVSSSTIVDGQNSSATFCKAILCLADPIGNIYVGEACGNIRVVNQTGYVTTLLLNQGYKPLVPYGLTFNGTDKLLYTTWNPNAIRSVDIATGNSKLVYGNVTLLPNSTSYPNRKEGQAPDIAFNNNGGLIFDELGNLLIAETQQSTVISKINTTNYYSLFAGSTVSSGGFGNGVGVQAKFSRPRQMVMDSQGRLYVTDQNNNAIRMVVW